jgi:uncharacterized protein YciI
MELIEKLFGKKSIKLECTMFIAISTYKKPIQEVDLHREAHRRFLKTYIENKMFIVSGGRLPKEGGIILAKVKTRKQLNEILNQDPFIKANVSEYKVYEFNPGLWDESFSGFIES